MPLTISTRQVRAAERRVNRRRRKKLSKARRKFMLSLYKPVAQQLHRFVRRKVTSYDLNSDLFYADSGSWAYNNYSFAATDTPNFSEFSALFEQFRIDKIVAKIYFNNNVTSGQTDIATSANTNVNQINCFWIRSTDTSRDNLGSGELDAMQNSGLKQTVLARSSGKPITIAITPNILNASYETASATAYTPAYKKWISMTDSGTVHYGLSIAFQRIDEGNMELATNANADDGVIKIVWSYYYTMKGVN